MIGKEKPLCIIAGKNIVINGDVAFTRRDFGARKGDFTHWYYCSKAENIIINNSHHWAIRPKFKHFKSYRLWFKVWCFGFWRMTLLRKDAVYLTGVLKKQL